MKNATHQALSTVEKSSTYVFSSWLTDKKVEFEIAAVGLDAVKVRVLEDLRPLVGHGLSERKYREYDSAFGKVSSSRSFMLFLGNAMLNGENLRTT